MSGAAKVTISERDLSTTVSTSPGVYGAIVLPAPRGRTDKARLVTSESDLINNYTENSSIRIGADLALYSAATFLQASNKLWVIRAAVDSLLGGLVVPVDGSPQEVRAPASDLDDVDTYAFTSDDAFLLYASSPGSWSSNLSVVIDRVTKQRETYKPFRIRVYYFGDLKETHVVSRYQQAVDANGASMYIETVLTGSSYLLAKNNTVVDESVRCKNTKVTTVAFGDISQTRDFIAYKAGVAQQQSFTIQTGNTTGAAMTFKVAGLNIQIPANATTASAVASAIATADWSSVSQVDSVVASGAVVTLTLKESAGAAQTFTVTKPETVRTSGYTVAQAYADAVVGVPKVYTFTVNSGNSSGKDETISLAGTSITIPTAADQRDEVALAFDTATLPANSLIQDISATDVNVTVTMKLSAANADLTVVSAGGNTTTISTPAVKTAYVAPVATKPKIATFNVTAANSSGALEDFTLAGVTTQIAATSTNLADVASQIANASYTNAADIQSVSADGAVVTITFKVASKDAALPAKTVPSSISSTSCAVVRRYVAPTDAVSEQQSFTVLSGNTSGVAETVELAGVKVSVPPSADSAAEVAAAIAAANYGSVVTLDKVTASGATVTVTFTAAAGDASVLSKNDGSAPYGIYFGGGDDGTAVTDNTMVKALDAFSGLNVTLLLDGGRATPNYGKALIALAEKRMDCVALLSVPYAREYSADYMNQILDYRNSVLNANSSFAALYTPHVKVQDKYNDREIFVSPEGFVAAAISKTNASAELWYPAAGFRRGVLNVLDTLRRYSEGEMDVLYDAEINPIWFTTGKGIVIWGNKTLLATNSSLQSLNVRLLMIVIEPAIKEALQDYVFELNTPEVRNEIKVLIDDYMDNIKARKGVYDYYTVCDSTNNSDSDIENKVVNVWLFVKPTLDAEYIRFVPVITRYGMSFDDAFGRV